MSSHAPEKPPLTGYFQESRLHLAVKYFSLIGKVDASHSYLINLTEPHAQ